MSPLIERGIPQFRRVNSIPTEDIETEILPLAHPTGTGSLLVAQRFQPFCQIMILGFPGRHKIDILGRRFYPQQSHGRAAAGDKVNLTPEESVPLPKYAKKPVFI